LVSRKNPKSIFILPVYGVNIWNMHVKA
jgi:hypothetical protein